DEPPVAAVIPFGVPAGVSAANLNASCEAALRRIPGLKVVTAAQWDKEAKESNAGDDLEAMAKRLEADVLVTGSLAQVPQGWRLSIDVFDDKASPVGSGSLDLVVPQLGPAAMFLLEELLAKL